jgi:hypothetical protein
VLVLGLFLLEDWLVRCGPFLEGTGCGPVLVGDHPTHPEEHIIVQICLFLFLDFLHLLVELPFFRL